MVQQIPKEDVPLFVSPNRDSESGKNVITPTLNLGSLPCDSEKLFPRQAGMFQSPSSRDQWVRKAPMG
jgi:hypothetical protein